jgi:hypothetical protein
MQTPQRAGDTRELVTCERCGASTGPLSVQQGLPCWCLRCQLDWTINQCEDMRAEAQAARIEAEVARTQPRLPTFRAYAHLDSAVEGT